MICAVRIVPPRLMQTRHVLLSDHFRFRVPASQLIGGTNTVTVFTESLMDEPFFDGLGEGWATDSGRTERAILHQVELTVEYEAVAPRVGGQL